MSPEKQMYDAIRRFTAVRKLAPDFGPTAELVIPLVENNELRLPMILLTTAPDSEPET